MVLLRRKTCTRFRNGCLEESMLSHVQFRIHHSWRVSSRRHLSSNKMSADNTSTLCLKLLIWLPFEVPWIRVFPSAKWRQRIVKGEFREFVLNENSKNSSSDWKTFLISMPGALCFSWFLCSSYLLKEFSLELYIINLFGLFFPDEMGDIGRFFLRWGGVQVKLLQKMEIL